MHIDKLFQPSVGADLSRTTADLSALSVDVMVSAFKSYSALSAFVGYSDTPINL